MAHLYGHANVDNTALRILRKRGYKLQRYYDLDEEEIIIPDSQLWEAEKNGCTLLAHTAIELLGLATIYEVHGEPLDEETKPYWWVVDGTDIRDELDDTARSFGEDEEQCE